MANENYKTIEQRIFEDTKLGQGITEFSKAFVQGMYAGFATPFRIPTLLRKYMNDQTLIQRMVESDNDNWPNFLGTVIGMTTGVMGDLFGGAYVLDSITRENNYIPLIALGVSNLISGAYEIGRFSKSREEYKIMKEGEK